MGVVLTDPIGDEDIKDPVYLDIMPAGWYDVDIIASSQQTSASGYTYLKVVFEIVTPDELAGRHKIWFFGIYDGSEKKIAFQRAILGRIAKACGVDRLETTDQIEGKRVRLRISEDEWNNAPQNNIKEVSPSLVPQSEKVEQPYIPAKVSEEDGEIPF